VFSSVHSKCPPVHSVQTKFFLVTDVKNKLSLTSIWYELKNKSNAVFTYFLVTMCDVYDETTISRHYTYISPALWLQQTELRFVEKKSLETKSK